MSAAPPSIALRHRAAPTSRWLVFGLAMATFVTMLHATVLSPLMPAIAADLGTSVATLGQIPAASMFLAGALGVLAGPLIDRLGHRRALIGSLGGLVASALGMGVAPTYSLLLVAALAGAIGRAVVQPVAVVIASETFAGDAQRRAISRVLAGITGAPIVGIPLLTIIADATSWRVSLIVLALAMAILTLPLHRLIEARHHTDRTAAFSWHDLLAAYHPLLRHRPTLAIIVSSLLSSASAWTMGTYAGAYYAERHGYSTQQVGWVYFIVGVTIFAGSLLVGGRLGMLPILPVVVTSRAILGLSIAAVYILPLSALVSIGLIGVLGLAIGVVNVSVTMLLVRESPASRATTVTLNTVALVLGQSLGSLLGGVLLAILGFAALGVAGLLLAFGAAFLAWLVRSPLSAETPLPAAPA